MQCCNNSGRIGIGTHLDQLCRRITGPGGGPRDQPVLVAFGSGAQVCSSGFGYAPAPLKRLRQRLSLVHGARVSLVHEAYTSQKCCRCHQQLQPVYTTRVNEAGERTRVEVHGVKRCTHCRNEHKPWAPKFWHRDVNAAWNILQIYLALGATETRPSAFNAEKKKEKEKKKKTQSDCGGKRRAKAD